MLNRVEGYVQKFVQRPIQRWRGTYYETPNLLFMPEAKEVIRNWVLKPNPRLSEVSFIGVGINNVVDRVYAPNGNFSPNSGAFYDGFSGAKVDIDELRSLFNSVYADARLDQLLFLGHLHPSGEMFTSDKSATIKHILSPRDALLTLSEGDFEGAIQWPIQNPEIALPNEAIAANTQNGPRLRIYAINALVKAQKYREVLKNKVPYQTIDLSE